MVADRRGIYRFLLLLLTAAACGAGVRSDPGVFCRTDADPACSDVDRVFECERDARAACGVNHARPIHYVPPIAGRTTAYPPTPRPDAGRSDTR